jgi:hypothetical protein
MFINHTGDLSNVPRIAPWCIMKICIHDSTMNHWYHLLTHAHGGQSKHGPQVTRPLGQLHRRHDCDVPCNDLGVVPARTQDEAWQCGDCEQASSVVRALGCSLQIPHLNTHGATRAHHDRKLSNNSLRTTRDRGQHHVRESISTSSCSVPPALPGQRPRLEWTGLTTRSRTHRRSPWPQSRSQRLCGPPAFESYQCRCQCCHPQAEVAGGAAQRVDCGQHRIWKDRIRNSDRSRTISTIEVVIQSSPARDHCEGMAT